MVLFCGFLGHMILILYFQVLDCVMLTEFVLSMVVSVIVPYEHCFRLCVMVVI